MTVIATGILEDHDFELRLEGGTLSGDEAAIRVVRQAIRSGADVWIAGVVGGSASLEDEWMAVATFQTVFPGCEIDTDAEPLPLEPGAIS